MNYEVSFGYNESMKKPINAKEILQKLESADDRQKCSLYLSKSIYAEFKKNCKKVPVSKVMEELMKQFNESAKEK